MINTTYTKYKSLLKNHADSIKTKDNALRRQMLNDYTDSLLRELDLERLREKISQKQYDLYSIWLTSYCGKRHEK